MVTIQIEGCPFVDQLPPPLPGRRVPLPMGPGRTRTPSLTVQPKPVHLRLTRRARAAAARSTAVDGVPAVRKGPPPWINRSTDRSRHWRPSRSAGVECCAPRPSPPPPSAPQACSPARPPPRPPGSPRVTPGAARPDQHPALHPARPAHRRPPGTLAALAGSATPGGARRFRRPHRRTVPGRARRRRAALHLRAHRHPAAVRRRDLGGAARRRATSWAASTSSTRSSVGTPTASRSATRAVYRGLRPGPRTGPVGSPARAGLGFGYHNHQLEFVPPDRRHRPGSTSSPGETDPRLVHFEVDLYWAWRGAHDPVDLIRANRGRIRQVHVKDLDLDGSFADPGTGSSTSAGSSRTPGRPARGVHRGARRRRHPAALARPTPWTPLGSASTTSLNRGSETSRGTHLDEPDRIRVRPAAGDSRSGRTTVGNRPGARRRRRTAASRRSP